MASTYRCPVCHLPVDMGEGDAASFMDHLWKHARQQPGRGIAWVQEQYDKTFPDGEPEKTSGDE